jgi:hypothetical protein
MCEKEGREKGREGDRARTLSEARDRRKKADVQVHLHSPLLDIFDVKFGATCQTEYSLMPKPSSKVTAAMSAREGRGQ